MKRHIALVGFMASGKSTIGKRLARKLGCAFVDVDDDVVAEHGSIADIFYNQGEAAFRGYESAALQRAIDGANPGVIALGGGGLETEANLTLLRKRSYRVFVKVSPEVVLKRLRRSKRIRPLLGPTPQLGRLKELYSRRMPDYAHADLTVEADGLSSSQAVNSIIAWLHKKKIAL